ncbi:MAG: diacylglycerol kinase family protein [Pseudomonadota bacterium]|nr:diacylglycerol kinase family protein [Pseudomonadota bacterium]
MSVPLFINPAAGRGKAARMAEPIQQVLSVGGVDVTRIESASVGDLEQRVFDYASRHPGPIIVAGGDGSVNEATNGILRAESRTPLGLIPIGTGNDFAKACGISLNWETAATLLAHRISKSVQPRNIDAGRMNERYFANGVGIGFDAKVNHIARKYQWPIGDFVYFVAVLEGLWDGVITPSVTMRYNDVECRGAITLANISIGPWVGGMFKIAPMALNDDGHLDLVYAEPISRRRVLALLPKLLKGSHVDETDIHCAEVESFELISEAPVPSHMDGESQPLQTEFRIRILKDAMQII